LEAKIETKLRAEFQTKFEEVKLAVGNIETKFDERLAEIRFFTPESPGAELPKRLPAQTVQETMADIEFELKKWLAQNGSDIESIELMKPQLLHIQKQQEAFRKLIPRLLTTTKHLSDNSAAFQTLHDRHENSINAILTFLATVYARALDAKGSQEAANPFQDQRGSEGVGIQKEHDPNVTRMSEVTDTKARYFNNLFDISSQEKMTLLEALSKKN
jgi:hypothetical protein